VPGGSESGSSSGVVEFTPNAAGAQNIAFPESGSPVIANYMMNFMGTVKITCFTVLVEGDYRVEFHASTGDAESHAFALALGGMYTSPTTGGTTGTLSGFTLPFYAGVQGNQTKSSALAGIIHFVAGQVLSVVNVSAAAAQLDNSPASSGMTASLSFELIRAGSIAGGP
jgi:hypothetical protein